MKRTRERFSVSLSSGETLRGDIAYTGAPSGLAIVYVHGFGSHRGGEKSLALESACSARSICFASFDFRAHGQSDGSLRDLRASRLLEDLAAIRHYLVGRGIRRLGLVGSSMGAFASAWFGQQAGEVSGCVLLAPAFRFLQNRWSALSDAQREAWQQTGTHHFAGKWFEADIGYGLAEERDAYRWETLAERWNKPTLLIHGMADEVVPVSESLEFFETATFPYLQLRLFKNGDHRLTDYRFEIADEACRFLSE